MNATDTPHSDRVTPSADAPDADAPEATASVTLSLVSHTNVGKTTLARTLLRRDVGEVLDQAHVTEEAERFPLLETPGGSLVLWDTPGFGDSARLLKHLRRHDRPLVWFFSKIWDRLTDRPLWSSQQAALNIRHQADVVLYLVNAAEDPDDAGYVAPELELLDWLGKPVVLVLNQTGNLEAGSSLERERLELWRRHAERFAVVRDVLALDAFSRCWVQEDELFARLAPLLPEDHRTLMDELRAAWTKRHLEVFERSVETMAAYLGRAATDRRELAERRPSKEQKEAAMATLATRLEQATEELTATLLAAHGLSGSAAADFERHLEAYRVEGENPLDTERSALLGGVLSGALGGLAADVMAGGLTFGGGLLAGAILGALGGAGLARGYELVTAGKKAAVGWSPAFLDQLGRTTLLRYLAIAHFGRGRGEFTVVEERQRWLTAVEAVLDEEDLGTVFKEADRQSSQDDLYRSLKRRLERATRGTLVRLYPQAGDLWSRQRQGRGGLNRSSSGTGSFDSEPKADILGERGA